MAQQTVIEWLIEQLPIRMQNYLQNDIEKAKEMEKNQIKESYESGWVNGDLKKAPRFGEDYYNKTYNK